MGKKSRHKKEQGDVWKQIEELYQQIPSFQCKQGCTDCCGPIPWAKVEWGRVKDKKCATSINCPYSLQGKCEVYEGRPMICRLFGASMDPKLQCPHGYGPLIPLTVERTKQLMDQYMALMDI